VGVSIRAGTGRAARVAPHQLATACSRAPICPAHGARACAPSLRAAVR
jgi:hypothetical protein